MVKYRLEMAHCQDIRVVEADAFAVETDWVVFFRRPSVGGTREYWRARVDYVVSIETVSE